MAVAANAKADAHFSIIVEGMNCTACATRLERVLSGADGVAEASVNFPLERASIRTSAPAVLGRLVEIVRGAGFDVALETRQFETESPLDESERIRLIEALSDVDGVFGAVFDPVSGRIKVEAVAQAVSGRTLNRAAEAVGTALTERAARGGVDRAQARLDRQRRMTILSAVLWLPFPVSMLLTVPGFELVGGPLLPGIVQAALATPIQFVLGARFYRGAYSALRGGGANMDVLVALGTTVAYLFSWYLLATTPPGPEAAPLL